VRATSDQEASSKGFKVDDVVKVVKAGSSFFGREATVSARP
jgi:hypothetical protein